MEMFMGKPKGLFQSSRHGLGPNATWMDVLKSKGRGGREQSGGWESLWDTTPWVQGLTEESLKYGSPQQVGQMVSNMYNYNLAQQGSRTPGYGDVGRNEEELKRLTELMERDRYQRMTWGWE